MPKYRAGMTKQFRQQLGKLQPSPQSLDEILRERHQELGDKKLLNGKLSRREGAELTAICRLMDTREVSYQGTLKELRRTLKAHKQEHRQ